MSNADPGHWAVRAAVPVLMILLSLVTCLILAEIGLRFYFSQNLSYDIEMSRYSNLAKQASPNPLIGHVHQENVSETIMGVSVETNSDGLRDTEYPIAKGDNYRIIFVGDSLTFGFGAAREDTFEYLLEQRFNETRPVEILNFGIGNYNTVQQVNLFKEKGLKYRPDHVTMFFFINDAEPLRERSSFEFLSNSQLVTFYWSRLRGLFSDNSSENGYLGYYTDLYADESTGWIAAKGAMLEMRALAEEHGFKFQVVMLPELHELVDYPFTNVYAKVERFLADNEIEVLDITPAFANEADPMSLWVAMDDAHPNAKAHAIIADASMDFIADRIGE